MKLPPHSDIFDRQGCMERLDSDEELILDVIGMFVEDCPQRLQEIKTLISNPHAREDLHRLFHSLKSAAGSAGAAKVQLLAFEAEQACSRGNTGNIEELAEKITQEFNTYKSLVTR